MDSPLSCPDSLGLARIAACSELTARYQLFFFGRAWNKQSQALIHNARAMPGGISGVIKYSPGHISTFRTSLEFAKWFGTWCGPEIDSWDVTGTTGPFPWVPELWEWQKPQGIWLQHYFHLSFLENRRTLCLLEFQESSFSSHQAQSEHKLSRENHRIWKPRRKVKCQNYFENRYNRLIFFLSLQCPCVLASWRRRENKQNYCVFSRIDPSYYLF